MGKCSICTIDRFDKHCTNTPQYCHRCCTTNVDNNILTCPYHFRYLSPADQAARLAAGRVHPSLLPVDGEDDNKDSRHDQPHGGPPTPPPSSPLAASSPVRPPSPREPAAIPAAPQPPAASATPLTTETITALLMQMQSQMNAQLQASIASLRAELSPQPPTGRPAQPVTPPPLPYVPMTSPQPPPLIPPPHHSAILSAPAASHAEIADLVNRFSAHQVHADSDDDEHKVPSPPSHTHTSPARPAPPVTLPPAFIPTSIGSDANTEQRFTSMLTDVMKKYAKSTITTIAQLDEALNDWVTDAIRQGQTIIQVEAIRAYQHQLINKFHYNERHSLTFILRYHHLWCKALYNGEMNLTDPHVAFNPAIFHDAAHPLHAQEHSSSSIPRKGKLKHTGKSATPSTPGGPPSSANKYPAGSCANHPDSTSHNTAMCVKGKPK